MSNAAASAVSCSVTVGHRAFCSRAQDRRNQASSAIDMCLAFGHRLEGGRSGSAKIFIISSAIVGVPQ